MKKFPIRTYHISNVHKHGVQTADTSLHLDGWIIVDGGVTMLTTDAVNDDTPGVYLFGNDCTACIRLEIDEPSK